MSAPDLGDGIGRVPARTPGAARVGAYYNEFDPFAAGWIRNLIAAGHITDGVVDDRSIHEIQPRDLPGRAHFFAGIAGWELALQLAGWPEDLGVWTGSCPCQPFSAANQGERRRALQDPRHLWPVFFSLIKEQKPGIIFGEQVDEAIGEGWLDGIFDDLEGEGYACAASVLPACSVSAPQIRGRIFWVASAETTEIRARLGQVQARSREENPDGLRNGCAIDPWASWEPVVRHDIDRSVRCRIELGTKPMAPRVPAHMDIGRAYGNAIVPQVAAEFIAAFIETHHQGEALPEPSPAEGSK